MELGLEVRYHERGDLEGPIASAHVYEANGALDRTTLVIRGGLLG